MRLRLAALLIPCLALGGCVSRGDGSVLEVVLVDEGAAGQGVVIGAAASTEGSDIASLAPLPPPRPPEFGGVVLAASVGQEHRLGRWWRYGRARNGIAVVRLDVDALIKGAAAATAASAAGAAAAPGRDEGAGRRR